MFSELYDKLVEAYKAGDKNTVSYLAEQWVSEETNNPFEPGNPARDLFYNAGIRCSRWKKGTIDSRRSRVMVTKYVVQILELNTPNPYTKVVLEEPVHVFGVIPEEPVKQEDKAAEFFEVVIPEVTQEDIDLLFEEPVVEVSETTTEQEVAKESIKPKKHGFSKRRKG